MKSRKITIVFLALFCCAFILMGCKDTKEEKSVETTAAVKGFADKIAAAKAVVEKSEQQIWTCLMHPEIQMPEAGLCPKCNMALIQ
jgi:Cu(I)/Ag(I) efflux system membrane fusion protein